MKIKYFVIAGSQMYGFMHGMYKTQILEFDAQASLETIEDEIFNIGYEMSESVIETYGLINENEYFNENGEFNEAEYWDTIAENVYYEIYRLKEKYQLLSCKALEKLVDEYGVDFAKNFCEEESVF